MFNCMEPDFTIRCLPEGVTFAVQKRKLVEGSEIFAGMFLCCDDENKTEDPNCVEIYESAKNVAILFQLLHNPPPVLSVPKADMEPPGIISGSRKMAIPHPLLSQLFSLAEKYSFTLPIMEVLHTHLAAQTSSAPLLVYGLATRYSLFEIADRASAFLALTHLEAYTRDAIKIIPSAEAYHELLLLQDYRKRKIKELLLNEELFPHGYGVCNAHKNYIEGAWRERREIVLKDIHSGTDVGAQMAKGMKKNTRGCKTCLKAWIAATEMLAYKFQKIVHRVSQLPHERDDI